MRDQPTYPASAVEQAMKVQEVILRALDGRLKWYQAAGDLRDLGPADAPVEAALRALGL